MHNLSPWLYELEDREAYHHNPLTKHDVVIIGAGVSGITTAYQILTQTSRTVTLVDAQKICRGATGHNAGQLVAEFEMGYKELVDRYGILQAREAEEALESSWDILKKILDNTNLDVKPHIFMGANGFDELEDLYSLLEDTYLRKESGLPITDIYITPTIYNSETFPRQYKNLVNEMKLEDMQSVLNSDAPFIALEMKQKGVLNSALFGEKLVTYMLEHFDDRFACIEDSPIKNINIIETGIYLEFANENTEILVAHDVVLCTNGLENFTITHHKQNTLNDKIHHHVSGVIGFMGALHQQEARPAMAYGYYNSELVSENEQSPELDYILTESHAWDAFKENPYIYVTERPFIFDHMAGSLTCIGGPERKVADTTAYDETRDGDPHYYDLIENIKTHILKHQEPFLFKWHGLMGFTPTSIRIVGQERSCAHLWYNLGCNGVGIMPAMYGSWKIGAEMAGKHFAQSVFDPK